MYFQDDKSWSHLRWYDESLDQASELIADAVHSLKDIDLGIAGTESTLGESGCWHVSIASMLAYFGEKLFDRIVDPKSLLRALRESKLGSMNGYVAHPFVDPISIITETKIQLFGYRDFGKKGVAATSAEVRNVLAGVDDESICAIINVRAHEFFGKGDPHYVLVHDKESEDNYVVHDPSSRQHKPLGAEYKKIYQITLYRQA